MDWTAFQFDYRLDLPRLMPHIAAVEVYRQAATSRILPPQWRELDQADVAQTPDDSQVAKAAAARVWVNQRFAPESPQVCWDDLLTLHRIVAYSENPECIPGVLRTVPVLVGDREIGIYYGAPPGRLPELMQRYVQFINRRDMQELHPLIQALLAHFFLVTIHPFGDANGRVARLLSTGLLRQSGYNVHGGFYALSAYFYKNDLEYHVLQHRCWQGPLPFDLTEFVAFGMQGFIMELKSIDSFVKMKLNRIIDREALVAERQRRTRRSRPAAHC
ncbi:MAG TPA: Fic family protein [Candidatus Sulfotelmatobacter sp.]|nr:Fic family protein [Candidatus Sulfotelmatobacter sp.]